MFMLCYEECKQKFNLCRAYIEVHQLLDSCMDLYYCYINLIFNVWVHVVNGRVFARSNKYTLRWNP